MKKSVTIRFQKMYLPEVGSGECGGGKDVGVELCELRGGEGDEEGGKEVTVEAGEEVEDVRHYGAALAAGGAVQVPVHVLHRPGITQFILKSFKYT